MLRLKTNVASESGHTKQNTIPLFLSFLFLFGIFFSSVTFNVTPGETSAISGLASALILFYIPIRDVFRVFIIASFSAIFCYVFVNQNLPEIVKQLFAYIQILLVFYTIRFVDFEKLELIIRLMIAVNLIVCFMQFFNLGTVYLQTILDILMSRSSATALVDIGRGVSGVTSEPSHLALAAFLQAFILLYSGLLRGRDYSYFCYIYILLMVILSSSGTGVTLLIIFLIPFAFSNRKVLFLALGLLFLAPLLIDLPDRLTSILSYFTEINWDSAVDVFYLSGFRFPSVLSSYAYSFSEITIGGPGSWFTRIIEAYDYMGIDYKTLGHFADTNDWAPTKPMALFANISLEFGILGLFFSLILLIRSLKRIPYLDLKFHPYYFVSIFALYFLSTAGNPEFLVIFALALAGNLNIHNE